MPLDSTVISSLKNSVALSSLNLSVFTGERVDRRVTDEIASNHNTDARDSGRYVKQIISKASLKPLDKIAGSARTWFYTTTVPSFYPGCGMFNMRGFFAVAEQMRKFEASFQEGVDEFIRIYPDLVDEARDRLKGMFDPDDYPDIAGMRNNFQFNFRIMPMPDTNNWFFEQIGEQMAEVKASAEDNIRDTLRKGVANVYQRVVERTKTMAEKLEAYGFDEASGKTVGVFRDSLVENVRELITILPALNVTDDPQLDDMARQLHDLVRHDAAALRADETFRQQTAQRARELSALAGGFL